MRTHLIAGALALAAGSVRAQDVVVYTTSDSYDDVAFAVENAITGAGLVIDAVSHVGEMLERTRADVGSDRVLFAHGDVYQFCSARVSRQVIEAEPLNIGFCPYGIFVAELADRPGEVMVGYRVYPQGAMQAVQDMLDAIVKAALGQ